ncbi:hypothetical protein Nepgr_001380 [Nepenthes gracilis]|uniref:Pentatricopeptide repeat-containing protein n=1 Tax=Nepenthes gracilis TaxID=150966 RepID=A0AAD3RXE9_NEPGR|nr:hypothetical protein Nepgr_001380 [Nepenthes gracilis]
MTSFATKYLKSSKRVLTLLDHQCLTISQLKQIQSHLTVSGTLADLFAAGRIITCFATSDYIPCIPHAYQLFIRLPRRTAYMWNTMIKTFTEQNEPNGAISLYKKMLQHGFLPNNYTFSFIIRSSIDLSDLSLGLMIHSQVVKLGWESYDFVQNGLIHLYAVCNAVGASRELLDRRLNRDVVAWTAVINGYVKSGQVTTARQLFDEMPERNAVSWSAMITGYTHMGYFIEALDLFNDMLIAGLRPNHTSIVGALIACASLGALDQGRWIHAYVDRNGMELDIKLGTALVDLYAKCGCIETAIRVFEDMQQRDVFAFTSLITGLSNHGMSARAIQLFRRMQEEGVNPNEVTFICILSACSRTGLVEKGLEIFMSMQNLYGIEPGIEHYGCLMDLLGRAGLLKEAEEVVKGMPVEPDAYVLGALLNACRVHGNVEMGAEMVERLMGQSLDRCGVHTLLSNMYASANQWDGVEKVRKKMEEDKVKKMPGCSLIELNGIVHEFGVGLSQQQLALDSWRARWLLTVEHLWMHICSGTTASVGRWRKKM